MKETLSIVAVLCFGSLALAQVRVRPELAVQKGNPHFELLLEHQAQIRAAYEEHKLVQPSFEGWVKVESKAAARLFPGWSFYSVRWSETQHPENMDVPVSLAFGLEKTIGIHPETGKVDAELSCSGSDRGFGRLLVRHEIVLCSRAEAQEIWTAFCELNHRHWQELPFEQIDEAKWHLGNTSYDQVISATKETETVVTRTHYTQLIIDRESGRILSWEAKLDTSNKRTRARE